VAVVRRTSAWPLEASSPARADGGPRSDLPVQPTALIGREQELESLRRQLGSDARLLTLVGAPGVGKTRLAVAAAADLADSFADGVSFVDLAAVGDPGAVAFAISEALGLAGLSERPSLAHLKVHLRGRDMLLVLDNFEHVLAAAPPVAELIGACPKLRVLATSREPLRLRWEHVFPVPPLRLPDPRQPATPEALARVPAVALFLERAKASHPAFALSAENAWPLASLCIHLDGLPLAIELTAARVDVLTPSAMLARLEQHLPLPRWSAQDSPTRHQTLRDALTWSYDLLATAEQALFRRLASFVGGFTLEAAEALDGGVDLLASLLQKSLIQTTHAVGGETRFRLLETIRAYALEQLEAAGELADARRRHATYFLTLAERGERELTGPDQTSWFLRLERERDNLGAALRWAADAGDVELELRLAVALGRFWWMRGHMDDGRRWLDGVLARGDGSPSLRARASVASGVLAYGQGDFEHATARLETGVGLLRTQGNRRSIVSALAYLGMVNIAHGRIDRAMTCLEEGLALGGAQADRWGTALVQRVLASASSAAGDADTAQARLDESLRLYRAVGDTLGVAIVLTRQAELARDRGDLGRALSLLTESLELARELAGNRRFILHAAEVVADLAAGAGDPGSIARLLAAADALREATAVPRSPPVHERYARALDAIRPRLEVPTFDAAWAAGGGMSPDEIVEEALANLAILRVRHSVSSGRPAASVPGTPSADRRSAGPLSRREQQVLRLVADGLSNKEIARRLVITTHTAKAHVASILNKLGADTRAQAVALAARDGLLPPTTDPDAG
jgi:predicted ATPase/DNA-binding CsgD family transcriptional regulator